MKESIPINKPETKTTASVQTTAASADGMTVTYLVIVNTCSGQNAFTVEGGFDLPAALHPALRYEAQDDFAAFLNRGVVNTGQILMGLYMRALTEAEHKDDPIWNKDLKPERTLPVPSPQTAVIPAAAVGSHPKDLPDPLLRAIPANARGQLVPA